MAGARSAFAKKYKPFGGVPDVLQQADQGAVPSKTEAE